MPLFIENTNIVRAYVRWGKQHGWNSPLFSDTEKELSYRSCYRAAWALGKIIAARHSHGERIGVLLPSSVGATIVFYAALFYRLTPVMLNPVVGSRNFQSACRTAVISTVYTSKKFLDNLLTAEALTQAAQDAGATVVCLEDLRPQINTKIKIGAVLASLFPALSVTRLPGAVSSENEAAAILFTSGSEGAPKGVSLSHGNLLANVAQVLCRLPGAAGLRMLNCMPVFHSFGLLAGVVLPAAGGMFARQYPTPLHYRQIPKIVKKHRAEIFFSANTFLLRYADEVGSADLQSLRYVFAGAEKLQDATRTLWAEKFNISILEGYGVTETAPVIAVNAPETNRPGSVGKPLDGIVVRLEQVAGVAKGGRLHIKGPNVMLGYFHADKPGVLQPPPDGWHDTGDIVELDDDGYLYIKGRMRRFIKIAGEMVPLDVIGETLKAHWLDFDFSVTSLQDTRRGEEPVLLTTMPEANRQNIAAVIQDAGLPSLWQPRRVFVVENIPLQPTGKPDYLAIQQLAAECDKKSLCASRK
ncbi:AMP-binding protein [Candidatus Persebacteraceae bacterium Df01]|jgi:acyl-[acyl-carrier-protein]-phospholipid O-acyltransferase/long-chain-fatty-acid--[acyl-carrier-protein] ligase|uniref:AMP-binding protein n=1 Tax=Candidatus Doriopsillibacter californiensis TaxID=2970740 RepID=A0ABT7QJ60_9GAMM|nr:AMP-binding protein [Candidatus Persebacteraceae bacterium Df01]